MITIIVGIVCFYLGFCCCALLTTGRDVPQLGAFRVRFEKWIVHYFEGYTELHRTENGDYADYQTHDMWQAFQAAIAKQTKNEVDDVVHQHLTTGKE